MRLRASLLLSLLTLTLTTASPAPDIYERDPALDLQARDPSLTNAIPINQERAFTPDLHTNHERQEAALPNLALRDAIPSPATAPQITPAPALALAARSLSPSANQKTIWKHGPYRVIKDKPIKDPNAPKVEKIRCLGPYGRTFCQSWCYCDKEPATAGQILCDKKVNSFRKGDRAIKDIHALSLRGFCGPICSCLVDSELKFGPLSKPEWDELRRKLNSLHSDQDEGDD
ncbi:hypothetical protein MMC30_002119 [Trapelia coarctata]|nr:hypothetical protein [Trapelia coarctata]